MAFELEQATRTVKGMTGNLFKDIISRNRHSFCRGISAIVRNAAVAMKWPSIKIKGHCWVKCVC